MTIIHITGDMPNEIIIPDNTPWDSPEYWNAYTAIFNAAPNDVRFSYVTENQYANIPKIVG